MARKLRLSTLGLIIIRLPQQLRRDEFEETNQLVDCSGGAEPNDS